MFQSRFKLVSEILGVLISAVMLLGSVGTVTAKTAVPAPILPAALAATITPPVPTAHCSYSVWDAGLRKYRYFGTYAWGNGSANVTGVEFWGEFAGPVYGILNKQAGKATSIYSNLNAQRLWHTKVRSYYTAAGVTKYSAWSNEYVPTSAKCK